MNLNKNFETLNDFKFKGFQIRSKEFFMLQLFLETGHIFWTNSSYLYKSYIFIDDWKAQQPLKIIILKMVVFPTTSN